MSQVQFAKLVSLVNLLLLRNSRRTRMNNDEYRRSRCLLN